jgi:phytoene desaturase
MTSRDAVIIGAGVAGLTTAIRLAADGWRVRVLEQNASVGGKMGQLEHDGYRWDTGPSVITMRHVLDELFASVGRQLDDYLTLLPVDPLTRYFYPDGTVLDVTRDWPRMAEQIAALDERDVEGYLAYLAYAARIHRITGPVFIYNKPPKLWDILSVPLPEMPHVDPLRTMSQAINGYVRHPHLRQLLGRFATYTGASPYRAPATLNVIAHVELNGGVWYPQGGIYRIADALAELAGELGVEIHTGTPVEAIKVRDGRAVGVTANGTDYTAEVVVANLDVALVYEKLLPPHVTPPRRLYALTALEPSCSGFILLLGIEGTNDPLAHHNIFFSADYPAEFDAIFRDGVPPADPTIYVSITGKSDPTHAPHGHENWFVLVNAPPLGDAYDWTTHADAYRDHVLDKLATVHGVDVRDRVRSSHMLTPLDLERLTGARRGALYGASSNSKWTAFKRPHNRADDVRGLYFAGGTTHPGGGVPMVMLSGMAAARVIAEDNG